MTHQGSWTSDWLGAALS